ncbi:hypothetical protein ABZ023_01395 [Streptomyces sp. NPDC006367]
MSETRVLLLAGVDDRSPRFRHSGSERGGRRPGSDDAPAEV